MHDELLVVYFTKVKSLEIQMNTLTFLLLLINKTQYTVEYDADVSANFNYLATYTKYHNIGLNCCKSIARA